MSNPSDQLYDLSNVNKIKDIKTSLRSVYDFLDSRAGESAASTRLKHTNLSAGIATLGDLYQVSANLFSRTIVVPSEESSGKFSNWTLTPSTYQGNDLTVRFDNQSNEWWVYMHDTSLDGWYTIGAFNGLTGYAADATQLVWTQDVNAAIDLTATREELPKYYYLSGQDTKHLQPAGDYAFLDEIPKVIVPTTDLSAAGKAADAYETALAIENSTLNLVPVSRTINGNPLTGNIVLDAADVSAATEAFVLENITQGTAIYRGSYASKAALTSIAWQTTDPSAQYYVSNNDYAVVQDDESHNDECWRYLYVTGTGWTAQYMINESPLTQAQLNALNSGATSAIINSVAAKVSAVTMNGSTKTPTNGVVDLGTVLTAHQSLSAYLPKSGGVVSNYITINSNEDINTIISSTNGGYDPFIKFDMGAGFHTTFGPEQIEKFSPLDDSPITATFPNESGRLIVDSNLSDYLPLSGGAVTNGLSVLNANGSGFLTYGATRIAGNLAIAAEADLHNLPDNNNIGLILGSNSTISSVYGVAIGLGAVVGPDAPFAFVYNGDMNYMGTPYASHGMGTFNINPNGGLSGFYIGDENLTQILSGFSGGDYLALSGGTLSGPLVLSNRNGSATDVVTLSGTGGTWKQLAGGGLEIATFYWPDDWGNNGTLLTDKSLGHYMIENVSWDNLTALIDNDELIPGTSYRITDYVTEVDQADCRSAEHQFDIIVTAISKNELDENARATIHNGDTYFDAREFHVQAYQDYLEYGRVPLESWELKYCIYNDKTRFKFADETNGKGVIYYMKDEFGNEAPYDFKNVQFKRYLITEVNGDNSHNLVGTYGLGTDTVTVDTSDYIWCYTFNGSDYSGFGLQEEYDFSGWHIRPTAAVQSQFGCSIERLQKCARNVIREFQQDTNDFSLMSFKLPNIVFQCQLDITPVSELPFIKVGVCAGNEFGLNCFNNTFGYGAFGNIFRVDCHGNSFGDDCHGNSFGDDCTSNSFGNGCNSNSFGDSCQSNSFWEDCSNNSFGNRCQSNSFGYGCYSNSFGNDCTSNSFEDGCYNNSFGNSCVGNSFGYDCYNNSFGNNCTDNSFVINCGSNSFGDSCQSNSFGQECDNNFFGNTCGSNSFGDSCNSNSLGNNCTSNSFVNYCYGNSFGNGCNSNFFGSSCQSNSLGNGCYNIKFGTSSSVKGYYNYITVESGNQRIYLNCTTTTSSSQLYRNVTIKSGVNNTTTWKTISDSNFNQTFNTTYQPANSQVISI